MFLSSKSSSMASSIGATTFPDLSLQISPPAVASEININDQHNTTGCITNRPPSTSSSGSDFSQENTNNHHNYQQRVAADMGGLLGLQFCQPRLTLGLEMGTSNHRRHHPNYWNHHYHPPQIHTKRSSRTVNGVRRSARAPRMRWTSTLHAHFIHAVQLLGGHERATPKSVQELMNVKDLTLAHVKSHLQMYRTVKSTDREADALTDMQARINPRAPMSLFEVGGEISPSTSLQISQRSSLISSLETNDSSFTTKESTSSDCQLPMHDSERNEVILRLSKKIKKLEKESGSGSYSSSSGDDRRLLNLEFTLGRTAMHAGRQVDQIF